MNKILILLLVIFLVFLFSCKRDNYETRNIYVEGRNLPDSILSVFSNAVTNRCDTIHDWGKEDGNYIIYKYHDASVLPKNNLLNGTRKVVIELFDERDSVGNPYYSFSLYNSEDSTWKRVYNFGRTSFYMDTVVSSEFIANSLIKRLDFKNWKGQP